MLKRFWLLALLLLAAPAFAANTYFVDFSGGSDAANGTSSSTPWQHAPGDASAGGSVVSTLSAGDTVVFKGGVTYTGNAGSRAACSAPTGTPVIYAVSAGSVGNPITYISGDVYGTPWGTGRAVIDGQSTRAYGFLVTSKAYITIKGFEIKNIGVAGTTDSAAGIDVDCSANYTIQNNKIHDIDYCSGTCGFKTAYGIENNHGSNGLIEKNEIYNAPEKLIEMSGTGSKTSNDANSNIIRYNTLYNDASHLIVITGDSNQVYNNLLFNTSDTTHMSGHIPGYCTKVDQGKNNYIFNNICYTASAAFGILVGSGNVFAQNIAFNVGGSSGGNGGSNDSMCYGVYNDGTAGGGGWAGTDIINNLFYNNICYYINGVATSSNSKTLYTNAFTGTGNEFKNNILFAASGETTSSGTIVRTNTQAAGTTGTPSNHTVSDFQTSINTYINGSSNVASGNIVADPTFNGGTLGAFTPQPTIWNSTFTELDQTSYHLKNGSPALSAGLDLTSLCGTVSALCTDIIGVARPNGSAWDIGPYQTAASCTPDHLTFTSQPSNASVNAAIGTVTIGIYDASNIACGTATNTVTFANNAGSCTGMTLGGTKTGAASSGSFSSNNMTENTAGACQIDATASGLTGATSNSFTVSASSASGAGRARRK